MKKQLIFFALVLISLLGEAKNQNPTPVVITAQKLGEANTRPVRDTIYDDDYFNANGSPKSTPVGMKLKSKSITGTLLVNPAAASPSSIPFSITLQCAVKFKEVLASGAASTGEPTTKNYTLSISYDAASATYKAKDWFTIPNAAWADITITKITSNPATFTNDNNNFRLDLQYQAEKFIVPSSAQYNAALSVLEFKPSRNSGYVRMSWASPEPDWVERYDVEYLFVDNYDGNGGAKTAASVPYDFRFNSTRVSTANTELEIPLVFEQGFIVARLRAVGMQGPNFDEPIYGKWDLPTSATSIPADNRHVYQITAAMRHENDKINWQYVGAFAGDDLRKDAVVYMDGTLRSRQSVSTAHTDLNLFVSETIYDYQGRPAIQALPAPAKPQVFVPGTGSSGSSTGGSSGSGGGAGLFGGLSLTELAVPLSPYVSGFFEMNSEVLQNIFTYQTSQPRLGFQKNFNQNSEGAPYNKQNFDADRESVCNVSAEPFNTNSGAAKYYSANNPDKTGFNQFIPDAEGYPFTQITYTPDKTNRAAVIAKAGGELKLGSGHEQKIFYGTPSQDELDRMFGTDAGNAAHYKKEMVLDENGQAHLTYKDIKGNVVATALAGDAPVAYDTISHGTAASITLHLIEEDNRLDAATQSLVSQKSLLLASPTVLNFNYSLTPATYSGTYCSGTSFCYDCVYDLEIVLRNSCGDSVWGRKQPVGSLTPINSCSSSAVSFSGTTSTLPPGNYFISKRLTVNSNAVEQYVNDFRTRYICAQPLEPFLPAAGLAPGNDPCNQPCNECERAEIPSRSYAMIQPDGSVRNVSLPVTRRNSTDGNCVNSCNRTFPSPCAVALDAMLADVSPGGQYAEHTDTTQKSPAHPFGLFYPRAFAVSVLNDSANSLPVRNANWRNPVYDYQNRDSSTAYVEIGEDNLPAHLEIEIIERNGKRLVKPKYLEYVSDFVRYWQPQWAEALVAYHPEFAYYSWCINHQSSYDHDTLLQATRTYNEAVARNLVNHRSLGAMNDPFFREGSAADATAVTNALSNFAPLTGFPDFNVEEAVYLTVNCNNVNFSAADANACARGKTLYANPATADKEWNFYKDFYRYKKHPIHDAARRSWVLANSYFDNAQIGSNSFGVVPNPLYADRVKRFNDAKDGLTYLPIDFDTATLENLLAWRDAAMEEMKARCGGCNASFELTAFFNALALEKKLKQSLVLPAVTPLIFSRGMTRLFADSLSLSYNWATNAAPNSLGFTVSTSRGVQCEITLNKTKPYDWDSIVMLDSLTAITDNDFVLRARTSVDSIFLITGNSSCMNFRNCTSPRVCTETDAADDMAVLMKYLFQRSRYRNTNLLLRGSRGYTPHLGTALSAYAPNAYRWKWKMKTIAPTENEMTAVLEIWDTAFAPNPAYDNMRVVLCPFTLRVLTPGFALTQVADITDISRPTASTSCSVFDFILTAKTTSGAVFKIYGASCFKLFDCCHTNNTSRPQALCSLPVVPKFDVERTCLRDAEAVANNNRARETENRLTAATDSFRVKYAERCLAAAETLNASYTDAIYQITLLYYNRAGQLVKTIPPAGVRVFTATEIESVRSARAAGTGTTIPLHTMPTTYVYNSFNQVLQKTTPDEGTTRYCYDENGRAIMSQDASQLASNSCSYSLYDEFSRVIEGGRRNFSGTIPAYMSYGSFKSGLASAIRSEYKRTKYDEMPVVAVSKFPSSPKNLRNRVAAIESWEDISRLSHAMYFDYDVQGNTKNVVQNFKAIATGDENRFWKTINYDYNPVSGKVKRVWYQKPRAGAAYNDQLIHWYQYDADGRILLSQTGTNPNELEITRETEARYFYYAHGPLARVELGSEKIQGIDYAYTINGILKAINSGNANKDFDMGADGKPGDETHGYFPSDVFGESLNYFENDYNPISSTAVPFNSSAEGDLNGTFSPPLYNSFIRNTVSTIPVIDLKPAARAFKYDQAMRLSEMKMIFDSTAFPSNRISAIFSTDYHMKLSYDANGNIRKLLRRKSGDDMDDLTYNLQTDNNRLDHIQDLVTAVTENDLGNQTSTNYTYDASGRMKSDRQGGISNINWNNSGLIKQTTNGSGNIEYGYDAFGRRAWKKKGSTTDFYVRDATGNELAAYRISGGAVTCTSMDVYGVSRLGFYETGKLLDNASVERDSFYRGLKRFEIVNHIGDVQAVVSDKRVLVGSEVKAQVIEAKDYYPFGMVMPGRVYGSTAYRHGFQGMECNDDFYSNDNEYTTEFRQYDPRVGRWMSVDPKANEYPDMSPYVAFMNNPINFSDPRGDDPLTPDQFADRVMQIFRRDMREMAGMSMQEMYAHIADELLEDGAIQILETPDGVVESSAEHLRTIGTREEVLGFMSENATSAMEFVNEALDSYFGLQLAVSVSAARDAARRTVSLPRRGRAGTAARARYDRAVDRRLRAGRDAARAERAAVRGGMRSRVMRGVGGILAVHSFFSTAYDVYQIYSDWSGGHTGAAAEGSIELGLDVAGAALLAAGSYAAAGTVMVIAEVSGFGALGISTAGDSYNGFYELGMNPAQAEVLIQMVNEVERIRREVIDSEVAPHRMTTSGGAGSGGRRRR